MNTHPTLPWPRAIILVDMNAFFASIEQLDFPKLREQPVAVTNGEQGSCIITCSYEARAFGIKTGMRLRDARQLCPNLIQQPSRPRRYAQVSTKIMQALTDVTPDIEIFSVDEAFLDVTHCQQLHGSPITMGKMAKQKVWEASGLHCSVGVSGDKTTAKYAAKLEKPNGFTVIPPWAAKDTLKDVPVTDLCGIATGIGNFLANYGVFTCGDMEKLPISILAKRFGNIGRRIWYMCQGADPDPVKTTVDDPKSMGHGKVLPPNTRDRNTVLTYLMHMSEKLAARLRRHELSAQHFFIGFKTYDFGWLGGKYQVDYPTDDGHAIYQLCQSMLQQHWHAKVAIRQVQITALDPLPCMIQTDLFATPDYHRQQVNAVVDQINHRYGELKIAPAPLLNRSKMPNVIAPSWRPGRTC